MAAGSSQGNAGNFLRSFVKDTLSKRSEFDSEICLLVKPINPHKLCIVYDVHRNMAMQSGYFFFRNNNPNPAAFNLLFGLKTHVSARFGRFQRILLVGPPPKSCLAQKISLCQRLPGQNPSRG